MASREFSDAAGAVWLVWAVHPDSMERRVRDDPQLRPTAERRRVPQFRAKVTNPSMAHGWLVFETRREKRRLAPIPNGWTDMSVAELRVLLAQAVPVRPSRRLIE